MVRTRNIYDPTSDDPFKLSRSRIERFVRCPRCFYLDRRLGIDQVAGPGFALNIAVDDLLKKEFDHFRAHGKPHPIMEQHGVDAVPFQHDDLDDWRENFKGVQYLHAVTNFLVSGAVDDVWVEKDGTLIVVDYKATSTAKEITLDDKWKESYKRQMDIYQWLLRRNSFTVSDRSYFVYGNARKDRDQFHGRLEFNLELLPYDGDDAWVEDTLVQARDCLAADELPDGSDDCEWCRYRREAGEVEG